MTRCSRRVVTTRHQRRQARWLETLGWGWPSWRVPSPAASSPWAGSSPRMRRRVGSPRERKRLATRSVLAGVAGRRNRTDCTRTSLHCPVTSLSLEESRRQPGTRMPAAEESTQCVFDCVLRAEAAGHRPVTGLPAQLTPVGLDMHIATRPITMLWPAWWRRRAPDVGGTPGAAAAVVADLDQDPVAVAGGAHGQPAVPMTGSAHWPILRPCTSPTRPTIATGLRGVP